jgi:hypothetical protein
VGQVSGRGYEFLEERSGLRMKEYKFSIADWDNGLVIDLLNQFFWIVVAEFMGDWYSMYKSDIDLEYWGNRLEKDFDGYPRKGKK